MALRLSNVQRLTSRLRLNWTLGASAVRPLPTLPAVTGGYLVAYGLSRLIAGYAGPCIRVQRASDSAQQDIGFTAATGLVDMAAALTFATGSELRVVTWYDQTGGGKHATGSATAPSILPILTTMRAAYGPAFASLPVILHRGLIYPYTANQVAGLAIPSALSVNKANVGFLDAVAPNTSLRLNAISNLGSNAGAGRVNLVVQTGQAGIGTFEYTAAGSGPTTRAAGAATAPRINFGVYGVHSTSTKQRILSEDLSATFPAQDSATITGGALGGGSNTNSSAFFTGDRFAFVVFTGSATDSEVDTVRTTLSGLVGSTKRNNRIVLMGSSLPESRGANNLSAGFYSTQSGIRIAMGLLSKEPDAYNIAISGRTATTVRDQAAAEADPLVLAGANNIALIDVGGNDIANGVSGAATYAVIKTIAQARRAAGFGKIVVATLAQRTDVTGTPAKETERVAFNNALKAGQADIGYDGLIDYDAIPQLQNPSSSNTFYVVDTDGNYTHVNTAGQFLRGQKAAPVLQGLLQ